MSISKVTWHLADGVRACHRLLMMLEYTAASCHVACELASYFDSVGLLLDRQYWIGVAFEAPNELRFQTQGCCVDQRAANELCVGSVIISDRAPGGMVWRRTLDLDSEAVHFFSRSKTSQLQWLHTLLSECLQQAKQITVQIQSGVGQSRETI